MKKYALLDTDFISKTHSVQDNGNHLIDRVMELPEYEFFCHAQDAENNCERSSRDERNEHSRWGFGF